MTRLFGTDGVRGIAGEDLSYELAVALGRAAVRKLGGRIVIGRDTRVSGPMLEKGLRAGIAAEGGQAPALLGVIPTPGLAWYAVEEGFDCGIMITASHNAPEYNGIKFFSSKGFKLPDAVEDEMQAIVEEQKQAQREELMRRRKEAMEAGETDGEPEFTEGLFAKELELEPEPEPQIDYVAQAREQAELIISEANAEAVMIHDKATKDADTLREMARQEGYETGYASAKQQADEELQAAREALAGHEQELHAQYEEAMAQLEPKLLDTMLTVFDEVFQMQFAGKREMLLHLVRNAMRGIRETRQYKIRVSESEVDFLR